jgi:hypothetical protein
VLGFRTVRPECNAHAQPGAGVGGPRGPHAVSGRHAPCATGFFVSHPSRDPGDEATEDGGNGEVAVLTRG